MKKSWLVLVMCAFVLPAAAQGSSEATSASVAEKGKMLVAANGSRLGLVSRVGPDGAAQVIIDGRMVSVSLQARSRRLTASC